MLLVPFLENFLIGDDSFSCNPLNAWMIDRKHGCNLFLQDILQSFKRSLIVQSIISWSRVSKNMHSMWKYLLLRVHEIPIIAMLFYLSQENNISSSCVCVDILKGDIMSERPNIHRKRIGSQLSFSSYSLTLSLFILQFA